MTRDEAVRLIGGELAAAEKSPGNPGRVRVCARRAAGHAIAFRETQPDGRYYGGSALARLQGAAADDALPAGVRNAAGRLVAHIDPAPTSPRGADLLEDAAVVIEYFLRGEARGK